MLDSFVIKIAHELKLTVKQVAATAKLLEEGGTVPFIARYRKEATDSLDEVQITGIRDRLAQLAEIEARRKTILQSLEERQLLSDALRDAIQAAETLTKLEDIYQPYRPKRRTRATIAQERGLAPLAEYLLNNQDADPADEAARYIDAEKEVNTAEEALAGARDIIAEQVSDHSEAREKVRPLFQKDGVLTSRVITGKEQEGAKFRDYFEWSEPVAQAPSHRILAIRRGEKEGFLYFRIVPSEEESLRILEKLFVTGHGPAAEQIRLAVADGFKRLLAPSLETEARVRSKQRADEEAVNVFSDNLRELLLAPALGQKRVMAIDPGFRTGCKVVLLDAQGKLLHHDVIYPGQSAQRSEEARQKVLAYCARFEVEAIAIGNGTAGRETEAFVRGLGLPASITIVLVNESGASIYSASEAAREEFPDYDLTVRGSVSIGRRLMDPLAELVKIDAKSIGVGQYQHDVDQNLLKKSLDDVVVSCVNAVGVEVNTASRQLLSYVSGLNDTIASNIVAYRNEHGPFQSRKDLSEVPRLGPKTFEQAAGFLRIHKAPNPLDASGVHPESYPVVGKMAADLGCSVSDLMRDARLREKIQLKNYVTDTIGLPTLQDILQELAKPGRDPREQFETFAFAEGVETIQDLKEGMKLPGIVTNVTAFGAFVDIGVHQDGLVHISQLADQFVKDPNEVVKVQQKVRVTVLEVDPDRKRISLSMKTVPDKAAKGVRENNQSMDRKAPRQTARPKEQRQPRSSGSLQDDWFTAALKKK